MFVKFHPTLGALLVPEPIKYRPLKESFIPNDPCIWPVLSFEPDGEKFDVDGINRGRWSRFFLDKVNNRVLSRLNIGERLTQDQIDDGYDLIQNLDDCVLTLTRVKNRVQFLGVNPISLGAFSNLRPRGHWATKRTVRGALDRLVKRGDLKRVKGKRHSWRYIAA